MTKRVFILGAGFSYKAGVPLAKYLAERILVEMVFPDGLLAEARSLAALVGASVSPEELADGARQYALWRRLLALSEISDNRRPLGHLIDQANWWAIEFVKALEEYLPRAILKAQPPSVPEYIADFAVRLRADDTVITFNYDTLLEYALEELGVVFHLGIPAQRGNCVRVLKLHGSIDWFALNVRGVPSSHVQVLHDPKKLCRDSDPTSWWLIRDPRREKVENSIAFARVGTGDTEQGRYIKRAFPGFGTFKAVDEVPGLWFVWRAAMQALLAADEVYVIGYSLPYSDGLVRLAFSSVREERERPFNRVVIINPNPSPLDADGERVLGCKPQPVREGAEDIKKWSALLD